jgi:drug/metabolite transporter (DMT)-like permease
MPDPAELASASTSFWQIKILIPFIAVSLIWGATWIVIRDQLSVVPPTWSITYRFVIAAIGMFIVAYYRKLPLNIGRDGQIIAFILGLFQFILNFNFVYRAELYITSGLVAVMFALLIIPNALLGRVFLGQRIVPAFIFGSILAIVGVGALFSYEYEAMRSAAGAMTSDALVWGIVFTLSGVLCASVANVMQGSKKVQTWPIISLLAWAMFWGALGNALLAWVMDGPPVVEYRWSYWAGTAYLGLIGSTLIFPLYFGLIRNIGPGRAAYSSVIVPFTAMLLSTIFEDYRWTMLTIGGAALGLFGLLIAMQARKPRTPRIPG